MNVKLSYRDKVIFIIVICILVLVVGFFTAINPKIDEMSTARIQQQAQQAELDRVTARVAELPRLIEDMKEVAEGIDEVQQNFHIEADPYLMEQLITDLLSERRTINITGITTSYVEADEISQYLVFPDHVVVYPMKMDADLFNDLPPEVYAENEGIDFRYIPPGVTIGITEMSFNFEASPGISELLACLDILADIENEDLKTIIAANFSGKFTVVDGEPVSENSIKIIIFSIVPMDIEQVLEKQVDFD